MIYRNPLARLISKHAYLYIRDKAYAPPREGYHGGRRSACVPCLYRNNVGRKKERKKTETATRKGKVGILAPKKEHPYHAEWQRIQEEIARAAKVAWEYERLKERLSRPAERK